MYQKIDSLFIDCGGSKAVMASGRFITFDALIFDQLEFVTVERIQETWPMQLIISYPDTEENQKRVSETYSKYETANPAMVAWLNGKK